MLAQIEVRIGLTRDDLISRESNQIESESRTVIEKMVAEPDDDALIVT